MKKYILHFIALAFLLCTPTHSFAASLAKSKTRPPGLRVPAGLPNLPVAIPAFQNAESSAKAATSQMTQITCRGAAINLLNELGQEIQAGAAAKAPSLESSAQQTYSTSNSLFSPQAVLKSSVAANATVPQHSQEAHIYAPAQPAFQQAAPSPALFAVYFQPNTGSAGQWPTPYVIIQKPALLASAGEQRAAALIHQSTNPQYFATAMPHQNLHITIPSTSATTVTPTTPTNSSTGRTGASTPTELLAKLNAAKSPKTTIPSNSGWQSAAARAATNNNSPTSTTVGRTGGRTAADLLASIAAQSPKATKK